MTVALALVFVGAMLIWTGIGNHSVADAFKGHVTAKQQTKIPGT